jgi:hypothetical protein
MKRIDYRAYLRSVGRKPIRGTLRTEKRPGDKVLVRTDRPAMVA